MAYRLECKRKHETDNAVLVIDTESGEQLWIPLSQVDSMHFNRDGDGYMMITDWIAGEKGLG